MTTLTTHQTTCTTRQKARYSLWKSLFTMISVWRQRHALGKLDDHLLKDVGITPEQARREMDKPIWDVPENWLR